MATQFDLTSLLEVVAGLGQFLTGVAAAGIALLAHRVSRKHQAEATRLLAKQSSDAWLVNLHRLHRAFWDDASFERVRAWLADDAQYPDLREAIEVRFLKPSELSPELYQRLDLLDKFFNFLIRVRRVDDELRGGEDLWEVLFFKFWLEAIVERRRWHLLLYFDRFYRHTPLAGLLPRDPIDPVAPEFVRELRLRLGQPVMEEA